MIDNKNRVRMVLSGQNLVNTLRGMANGAKNRVWIVSPFIGEVKGIQRIIGGAWMQSSVDLKIITDIDSGFIKKSAFELLNQHGEIRSLKSVHAKIYMIDDWCLMTSANLTGTAFSKRYEVGNIVDDSAGIKAVEAVFSDWWNKARIINNLPPLRKSALTDYQDGASFSNKWKLPSYSSANKNFDRYVAAIDAYKNFNYIYEKETGRIPEMVKDGFTLFQETDYLFNFLYHEHPAKPSKGIADPRALTDKMRVTEIKRHSKLSRSFYLANRENKQLWRLERTRIVQQYLSPQNIDIITLGDLKKVVNCLHCYSSYPLNKTRFINNNALGDIISNWKNLLHTGDITHDKIKQATAALRFFGKSSVYELIGWYFPDKYPLMNTNSDSGMRFFGYNIK